MRRASLIVFACLMSLQLGMLMPRLVENGSQAEPATANGELPCLAQDAHHEEPANIDDRAFKQRAVRDGGALIESGQATEMAQLIKQLQLEQCELDLATDRRPSADSESLYEYAKESIVVISAIYKCDRCDNWHAGCASGFVITSTGAVATNYHVIDQPEKAGLVAMTADGRVLPVKRVLAADEANDIAIVQVEGEGLKPLPIAADVAVGTPIALVSHPDEHYYSYTAGVVSRYTTVKAGRERVRAMTITADFARGSSGAPVLNMQGEVVGIVRATESVYYSVENGQQKNLQMVFKSCVPSARLLSLVATP
mgnify:FL=1